MRAYMCVDQIGGFCAMRIAFMCRLGLCWECGCCSCGSGAVRVLSAPSDNGCPARAPVSYQRQPPQCLSGCFCPLLVSSVARTLFCSRLNWKFILFYFHPILNSPAVSFPFEPMRVKPDE